MLNQRLLSTRALLAATACSVALASTSAIASAARTLPTATSAKMVHGASQSVSQFTVIYGFSGPDGAEPNGPLVVDLNFNIFGVTQAGGATNDGTIFSINANSNAESTVHTFSGPDGIQPTGGLLNSIGNLALTKNLFGVAQVGGTSNGGTLYQALTTGGIKVLHNFTGGADGNNPVCRLLFFTDGKLYGTTSTGGANNAGTIFSYDGTNFKTIYTFTGGADGGNPFSGVTAAVKGASISPLLYGTTSTGGANGGGTLYSISPSGVFKVLHSLAPATDGSAPEAEMIPDFFGNLYGTTSQAGSGSGGTVFELSTSGAFRTLYSFPQNATTGVFRKGATPLARLAGFSGSWLYGSTSIGGPGGQGTIFKLSGSKLMTLHAFSGPDGATPVGQLLLLPQGIFGTTFAGGPNGGGEVFQLPY